MLLSSLLIFFLSAKVIVSVEKGTKLIESIFEKLPIGVAVNDAETGKAVFVNSRFSGIYGWSYNEINGVENFFDKVYPDPVYREKMKQRVLADIASGDEKRMSWDNVTITTSKGVDRVITATNIPVVDRGLMISTVQDMTERALTLQQLELNLSRTETLLKKLPLGVVEWDKDMKIILWSGDCEKIFGWNQEEVEGKHYSELGLVYTEDNQVADGIADELVSGKVGQNKVKNRNVTKDGRVITCQWYNSVITDADGNVIRIMSIVKDKTKEEENTRRLERTAFYLENMSDPILVVDLDLKIVETNSAAEELWQEPHGSLIGREVLELFPKAEHDLHLSEMKRVSGGTVKSRFVSAAITRGGKIIPVELSGAAIFKNHKLSGFTAIVTDLRECNVFQ